MEAIHHNPIMHPSIVLHTDDEMIDSDYENRIQQDEDYDIDLEGGDAYSNAGMDEEMKFDTTEDMAYDNDDLMLDEADYPTSNAAQEEEIILLDVQQPEEGRGGLYEVNISYEPKQLHPAENIQTQPSPMASVENAVDFQSALDISVNMTSDPVIATQPEYEITEPETSTSGVATAEELKIDIINEEYLDLNKEPQVEQQEPSKIDTEPSPEEFASQDKQKELAQESLQNDRQEVGSNSSDSPANQHSPQAPSLKLHPVIAQFESNTLSLFNSECYINYPADVESKRSDGSGSEAYPEIPTMYLLNDVSLATKGFDEIFTALREMFADEIGEDAELTIEIDELELFLHEDNLLTKSISLSDLSDLYLRLCLQDGLESPHPMYVTLATQPRFTKRYSELLTAAGEGKGVSQVRTYASAGEYQASTNVHDTEAGHTAHGSPEGNHEDECSPSSDFQEQTTREPQKVSQTVGRPSAVETDAEFVLAGKDPIEDQEDADPDGNEDGNLREEIYPDQEELEDGEQIETPKPSSLRQSPKISSHAEVSDIVEEIKMASKGELLSEVTVEEITDDSAPNALSAEEIDEPEDSVAAELQSVTEVTVEVSDDEEELLEYEEENVGATGSSSPNVSPNVEAISDRDQSEDIHNHQESSNGTAGETLFDPSDFQTDPTVDSNAVLADGDHKSMLKEEESPVEGQSNTEESARDIVAAAEELRSDQVNQLEEKGSTYQQDLAAEQQHLSNNESSEELQPISTWIPTEEGEDESTNENTEEGYYHGYDYQEGDEQDFAHDAHEAETPDVAAFNAEHQEISPGAALGTHEEPQTQYEDYNEDYEEEYQGYPAEYGAYEEEYEGQGEYQDEEEYEQANGQDNGGENNENRQSPFSAASPNGKRLRDGDDADSLDVQHIKRTRSQ